MTYGAADDPSADSARRVTFVVGADGRVEQAYGKVSVRVHPAEILKLWDEKHPKA